LSSLSFRVLTDVNFLRLFSIDGLVLLVQIPPGYTYKPATASLRLECSTFHHFRLKTCHVELKYNRTPRNEMLRFRVNLWEYQLGGHLLQVIAHCMRFHSA